MKHRVEEHPLSLRPKMAGVVLITDSKVVKPLKPFYYSQNNWPTSPFRRADLHECTLNRKMTGRYKKVNVLNETTFVQTLIPPHCSVKCQLSVVVVDAESKGDIFCHESSHVDSECCSTVWFIWFLPQLIIQDDFVVPDLIQLLIEAWDTGRNLQFLVLCAFNQQLPKLQK